MMGRTCAFGGPQPIDRLNRHLHLPKTMSLRPNKSWMELTITTVLLCMTGDDTNVIYIYLPTYFNLALNSLITS